MPIAYISEFVSNGILTPINMLFIITWGLLEPIIRHLTTDHPNFIYSWLCVFTWLIKLMSVILGITATNATVLQEFNKSIVYYSIDYENFTGNIAGTRGMSYIAKNAYIELNNQSKKLNTTYLATNFSRALNAVIKFSFKSLEMI
ncbi:MAG: hypothetical protein QXN49_07605 [Archaeoglobaceae archaeon]